MKEQSVKGDLGESGKNIMSKMKLNIIQKIHLLTD